MQLKIPFHKPNPVVVEKPEEKFRIKLPKNRTVNINIESAQSVEFLPNCDLRTLRRLENETGAVAALRIGARNLRLEREGGVRGIHITGYSVDINIAACETISGVYMHHLMQTVQRYGLDADSIEHARAETAKQFDMLEFKSVQHQNDGHTVMGSKMLAARSMRGVYASKGGGSSSMMHDGMVADMEESSSDE